MDFGRRQYDSNTAVFNSVDPLAYGVSYNPTNSLNSNITGNNQLVGIGHGLGTQSGAYSLAGQNTLSNREWDGYVIGLLTPAAIMAAPSIANYLGDKIQQAHQQTTQTEPLTINPQDYIKTVQPVYETKTYIPSWQDYSKSPEKLSNDKLESDIAFASICSTDTTYPYGCNTYHSNIAKSYNLSVSPNIAGYASFKATHSYSYSVLVKAGYSYFDQQAFNQAGGTIFNLNKNYFSKFFGNLLGNVKGDIITSYNNYQEWVRSLPENHSIYPDNYSQFSACYNTVKNFLPDGQKCISVYLPKDNIEVLNKYSLEGKANFAMLVDNSPYVTPEEVYTAYTKPRDVYSNENISDIINGAGVPGSSTIMKLNNERHEDFCDLLPQGEDKNMCYTPYTGTVFITPIQSRSIQSIKNELTEPLPNQPLGKGTTGRGAMNLNEQLAIKQANSNPQAGMKISKIILNDNRWPASDGWIKMRQNVNGIEVHYVYNTRTGQVDDFKIK